MPDINSMRQQVYNNQRANANQAIKAQHQDMEGALNRRMAAINQQGGAAIGAQLKLNQQVADQRAAVDRDINNQELQANIASEEANLSRQFQSKEAQLARDAASREALLGREFAGSQADKDMGFKRGMFDIENANRQREIDLTYQQYELDKDTTEFNKKMAQLEADKEPAGLLGGGGFLGSGLGTSRGFLGSGLGRTGAGTTGAIIGGAIGGPGGAIAGAVIGDAVSGWFP